MRSVFNLYKDIRKLLRPIKRFPKDIKAYKESRILKAFMKKNIGRHVIYYLGRTENNNLGDNGQYFCIKNWIKENYPDYEIYIAPSRFISNPRHACLHVLKKYFEYNNDFIVFQSGYCVQDLGGDHPLMHELICKYLQKARILMMPQTIYFQHEENKLRTALNHDNAKNMLFLARDKISYKQALEMFPHIKVMLFPDIVTTLIGKYDFKKNREKIFLCCRNDGEKFYSDTEIKLLKSKLETLAPVEYGDTQSLLNGHELRKVLKESIEKEIETLSNFKVVITDRYHGTIYALCANTPVIIIKTKDHKVTTGADWFTGIYDNYIYVSFDLDDAYQKAKEICNKFDYRILKPYFKEHYYDKLKTIFDNYNNVKDKNSL
jgi:exopolysaccharide biosynthesis predicted pyruvyltransferase EpsI